MKKKSDSVDTDMLKYLEQRIAMLENELTTARNENWVTTRVNYKENTRLYRKDGKKFVPYNDPWAYDGLRDGFWLIKVDKGCTSIRQAIYPQKADLIAAARDMEDQLIDIIRKASEAAPKHTKLTEEQKKDWDTLIEKHGDVFNNIWYPSFAENAEKIVKVLTDKAINE